VDWIGMAQDRDKWRALVNAGKLSSGYTIGDKWRALVNAGKLSSGYTIGGLLSSAQFHS
jgi:hypothetical protein